MSDQPIAETAARQHNTHKRQIQCIHSRGVIRNRNPSKRAAADPHLRPRGFWFRLSS